MSRSASFRSLIAAYERPFDKDRDAGNRPLDHYKARLGPMRNRWRNAILPIIRWETPILARIQKRCRHPVFDIYFALTANLGTHTAYVMLLPGAFWYGHSHLGRSLVFCLAFGVYFTNVFKDLLCLPRPLSPPLHRLTMSGSAALEYGFPSTHTANSVSVSLIVAQWFVQSKDSFDSTTSYYLSLAAVATYLSSIVIGRVYCGMHGFLDVIGGIVIGAGLWWFYLIYGTVFESFIFSTSCTALWIIPIVLIMIRVHPEPADDCPCFDDGVAFLGVVAGSVVGEWHFVSTRFSQQPAFDNSIPFSFEDTGFIGSFLRFLVGSILISIWRPLMKRLLYETLPPVFRLVERVGLSMPRRFFTPASQYRDIPQSIPDSTIFEPQNITQMFTKVGRARADSVGPQSTADVYESIAYREYQAEKAAELIHRRHDGGHTNGGAVAVFEDSSSESEDTSSSGTGATEEKSEVKSASAQREHSHHSHHHNKGGIDGDVHTSTIVVPRVRYDVEVVTKFAVYTGIGIIAVDVAGVCFALLGI